jgi:hypothetical protein
MAPGLRFCGSRERVRRAEIALEVLGRYAGDLVMSPAANVA